MEKGDAIKVKAKIDELKKKRAGKNVTLSMTLSDDQQLNFQHALGEIQTICQTHKLVPNEVWMLCEQMKWIALQVHVNNASQHTANQLQDFFMKKDKTHEEKQEEKLEKEKVDGKVRIKPGEELDKQKEK